MQITLILLIIFIIIHLKLFLLATHLWFKLTWIICNPPSIFFPPLFINFWNSFYKHWFNAISNNFLNKPARQHNIIHQTNINQLKRKIFNKKVVYILNSFENNIRIKLFRKLFLWKSNIKYLEINWQHTFLR